MLMLPKQENFEPTYTNTSKSHIIYLQKDPRECMIEHAYVPKISNHMNSSVCLFCCICLFGIYMKNTEEERRNYVVSSQSLYLHLLQMLLLLFVWYSSSVVLLLCLDFLWPNKQTNERPRRRRQRPTKSESSFSG